MKALQSSFCSLLNAFVTSLDPPGLGSSFNLPPVLSLYSELNSTDKKPNHIENTPNTLDIVGNTYVVHNITKRKIKFTFMHFKPMTPQLLKLGLFVSDR